jgi:hypothetical protein
LRLNNFNELQASPDRFSKRLGAAFESPLDSQSPQNKL